MYKLYIKSLCCHRLLTSTSRAWISGWAGASVGRDAGAAVETFRVAVGDAGVSVVATKYEPFTARACVRSRGIYAKLLAAAVGEPTLVDVYRWRNFG